MKTTSPLDKFTLATSLIGVSPTPRQAEAFYAAYHSYVSSCVRKRFSNLWGVQEEIVTEVFVAAFQQLAEGKVAFATEKKVLAWFWQLMHFKGLDRHRSRTSCKDLISGAAPLLEEHDQNGHSAYAYYYDPVETLEPRSTAILQAIEKKFPKKAPIFHAAVIEHRAAKDVAAEFGISTNMVYLTCSEIRRFVCGSKELAALRVA